MAKNKTKADNAMNISKKFKEVERLRQEIELKLREAEEMVRAENHPDFDGDDILKLRLAHAKSHRKEMSDHQSRWHNVAFERGFFDIEPTAKKLSKYTQ